MSTAGPRMLSYQCPHCQQHVTIDESLLGQKVECPQCDRPFMAEAPIARASPHESPEGARAIRSPANDETTVRTIHPVVFRRHFFGTVFSVILFIAGLIAVIGLTPWEGPAALIGGGILAAIGLFFLIKWYIVSRTTSLTLTNERIIYREGIINHRTSEVRHNDVRNIRVDRNLVERLLNFGDMSLSSAGQDDMEIVIHDIPDPEGVAQFIRDRQ